jgi:hypothetical protein
VVSKTNLGGVASDDVAALCIAALGTAFPVFLFATARALLTAPSHDNDGNEGTSFTVLVVVQTCGALVGTPAITAAWVEGMQLGGAALGLPHYVAAVCSTSLALCWIQIKSLTHGVIGCLPDGVHHHLQYPAIEIDMHAPIIKTSYRERTNR